MGVVRPKARTFRDLLVWRKAHELVLGIYRLTSGFPSQETYGLVAQMRRAAVSIPANIAEGFKRRSRIGKKRFLNISEGSTEEYRYYLILAQDLGYVQTDMLMEALEQTACLLSACIKALSGSDGRTDY
jgi:four helix bundle protein